MAEKEKAIENIKLPANVQSATIEDDLSEADLESVSGASLINCPRPTNVLSAERKTKAR